MCLRASYPAPRAIRSIQSWTQLSNMKTIPMQCYIGYNIAQHNTLFTSQAIFMTANGTLQHTIPDWRWIISMDRSKHLAPRTAHQLVHTVTHLTNLSWTCILRRPIISLAALPHNSFLTGCTAHFIDISLGPKSPGPCNLCRRCKVCLLIAAGLVPTVKKRNLHLRDSYVYGTFMKQFKALQFLQSRA